MSITPLSENELRSELIALYKNTRLDEIPELLYTHSEETYTLVPNTAKTCVELLIKNIDPTSETNYLQNGGKTLDSVLTSLKNNWKLNLEKITNAVHQYYNNGVNDIKPVIVELKSFNGKVELNKEQSDLVQVQDNEIRLNRISRTVSTYAEPEKCVALTEIAVENAIEQNKPIILSAFDGKGKTETVYFRYEGQAQSSFRLFKKLCLRGLLFEETFDGMKAVSVRRLRQMKTTGLDITVNENVEVLSGAFNPITRKGKKPLSDSKRKSHITLFLIHAFGVDQMSPSLAYRTVGRLTGGNLIHSNFIKIESAIKSIKEKAWLFDLDKDDIEIVIENVREFVELFQNGSTNVQTKVVCKTCNK